MSGFRPVRWLLILALAAPAGAEIIDRIAVSVGSSVITTGDLQREIRVTAFLNGAKPDFSPGNQRTTAQRLVEQTLIRRELELSRYPMPDVSAALPRLIEFRKAEYPSEDDYRRALAEAGITDQDLKDELLWQLTLLRFVELRFRPGVQVNDQEIRDYFDKVVKPAAVLAHPDQAVLLDDYREQIEQTLAGNRADKEMDNWLQETRKRTDIVFHEEVFR